MLEKHLCGKTQLTLFEQKVLSLIMSSQAGKMGTEVENVYEKNYLDQRNNATTSAALHN